MSQDKLCGLTGLQGYTTGLERSKVVKLKCVPGHRGVEKATNELIKLSSMLLDPAMSPRPQINSTADLPTPEQMIMGKKEVELEANRNIHADQRYHYRIQRLRSSSTCLGADR